MSKTPARTIVQRRRVHVCAECRARLKPLLSVMMERQQIPCQCGRLAAYYVVVNLDDSKM